MLDNKYMTRNEALEYLQIIDNYSETSLDARMSTFREKFNIGLEKIKVNGRTVSVYDREKVTKVANDVLAFFDKYYTKSVAEEKIGARIRQNQFESIEIPPGYTLIMKTDTGCGTDKVAYEKSIIDEYCRIKEMINNHYISRKEAMNYLRMGEKTFNTVRAELDEKEFNSKFYYKKELIEQMAKTTAKVTRGAYKTPHGFITKKDVLNLVGKDESDFKNHNLYSWFRTFIDGFKIETLYISGNVFYKKDDVINAINIVKDFRKEHYSREEVAKLLSVKHGPNIAEVVSVPNHYCKLLQLEKGNYSSWKSAFKKSQVDAYKNQVDDLKRKIETEEYISPKQSQKILSVGFLTLKEMRKEYNIDNITYGPGLYLNKNQIIELKHKCEEFYKEHLSFKDIKERYFPNNLISKMVFDDYTYKKLNRYDVPLFARISERNSSLSMDWKIYKKSEVEELIKSLGYEEFFAALKKEQAKKDKTNYTKKYTKRSRGEFDINYDIQGESELDTFYLRLFENWNGFSDESKYTKDKWFKFIENKIDKMRASNKVANHKVNFFINATRELDKMLKYFEVNEVYELTTNNINTYFNILDKRNYNELFYDFLIQVSNDVQQVAKRKETPKKGFNMKNVISPHSQKRSMRELGSYGFDVYSKLFRYATDLNIHVSKSIEEIRHNNTVTYASTWLYNILHLNNAWRHGDVTRFPNLDLQDIFNKHGIHDYKWFEENEVTLDIFRSVESKIQKWELIISKTGAKGSFFCSDELGYAFATSVLLLSLYNEKRNVVLTSNKESDIPLMSFTTKYNAPSEKNLEDYFSAIDIENFKFSSLRMNKTVMTLIYYLANLSGDSKALVYAQKLRGHIDKNSPLSYVGINIKDIDLLTKHLFARGEFGYITSLLISRFQNNNETSITFEDMTKQIVQVNNLFGELSGLYTTIGFLNTVKNERQLIIDTLAEKSLKDCQKILTEIFTNKLPSRMENIQCLISHEGCCKTSANEDEISCFDCPYHIPSIYALTTLCESIVNDLKKYQTASRVKQFKLCLSIDRKVMLVKEAIEKYGEEYVYNCIGIDRETFMKKVDMVDLPEDFQDLITQGELMYE